MPLGTKKHEKTHLNTWIIFAAARNLSLKVLVLIIFTGDIEKNQNPGPANNYI